MEDGGWSVVEPGATRALARASDEAVAIRRARAQLTRGGTVEVLDVDGQVTVTHEVAAPGRGPWWYTRPTVLSWLTPAMLGVQVVLGFRVWSGTLGRVFYVLLGVFTLLVIVSVVCSRVRDHRIERRER